MVETTIISNSFLLIDTISDILDPEYAWNLKSHWAELLGPEERPNQSGKIACSHIHYCPLLSTSVKNVPVIKIKIYKIQILLGDIEKDQHRNYL